MQQPLPKTFRIEQQAHAPAHSSQSAVGCEPYQEKASNATILATRNGVRGLP